MKASGGFLLSPALWPGHSPHNGLLIAALFLVKLRCTLIGCLSLNQHIAPSPPFITTNPLYNPQIKVPPVICHCKMAMHQVNHFLCIYQATLAKVSFAATRKQPIRNSVLLNGGIYHKKKQRLLSKCCPFHMSFELRKWQTLQKPRQSTRLNAKMFDKLFLHSASHGTCSTHMHQLSASHAAAYYQCWH